MTAVMMSPEDRGHLRDRIKLVVTAFALFAAFSGVLIVGGYSDSNSDTASPADASAAASQQVQEWVGTGRVCDFDGYCSDEFECRSTDGAVEIYLPHGSFATGNEGWAWQEDVGSRCGSGP